MRPLKIGYFFEAIPLGILTGLIFSGTSAMCFGILQDGNISSIPANILIAPLALFLAGIPAILLGFIPLLAGLVVYGQFLQNVVWARTHLFLIVPTVLIAGLIIVPMRWFTHLEVSDASIWPALIGCLFGSVTACWDFRRLYLGGKGVWS